MFNIGPSSGAMGGMFGQQQPAMVGGMGSPWANRMRPPMMPRRMNPNPNGMPQPNAPTSLPSAPPSFSNGPFGMATSGGQLPQSPNLDLSSLTGGNTGVTGGMGMITNSGQRPGGLWSTYSNMVQGDGLPQRRNLVY